MELQQIFWQTKLSPKQLIIDWDRFISLFDQFILETISLKLNHVQKDYIKTLIDPQNRNLVYKNSYLLFVKNFWELPSNRTKLLKGQLNLSTVPRFKMSTDMKDQQSIIIKIKYLPDLQQVSDCKQILQNSNKRNLKQKIFQLKRNIVYELDPKLNIISQKSVNVQNFLTIGRNTKCDISIEDCQSFNQQHFKLIKFLIKKPKQNKPYYMTYDDEQKSDQQTNWYVRDVSKSNRLQYLLSNPNTYVVLRKGLSIKIGLTDQYELQVMNATADDVQQFHLKEISTFLNTDRINYLGQIDPEIPQKVILDIPTNEVKSSGIQKWYNKGLNYEQKQENFSIKKSISNFSGDDEQLPLVLRLVDKITHQVKQYKLVGESIKVGRNKSNKIFIDRVTIRDVECQLFCISGIWMIKNIPENCPNINVSPQTNERKITDQAIKNIKMKQLSVGLTIQNSVQNLQSSNRIKLPKTCDHQIKGKNFIINLSFPKIKDRYK